MAHRRHDSAMSQSDLPLIHDANNDDAASALQSLTANSKHNTNLRTLAKSHWLTPTNMLASYIFGIALAVGHHRYYTMLDRDVIGSTGRQQWSLRYVPRHAHMCIFRLL
ncbi:hypothetical protein BKA58DRAFT_107831 [Alternaria rosae]|uniref:uncharacterized protein n=1 Tax=Alternaria rosae TaxID=1187941 RepID=UPI001E8CCC84|nr:uncharacterized protein BKA58DRAFT_107831 [Alternaria rosae]KAH6878997.1 hypothetical protein BKA58DRAFT_107831 [Alternaria rosae]